jgi:hypothetical protein
MIRPGVRPVTITGFNSPNLGSSGEVRLQYLDLSTGRVGLLIFNFVDNGGANCDYLAQFVVRGPKTQRAQLSFRTAYQIRSATRTNTSPVRAMRR